MSDTTPTDAQIDGGARALLEAPTLDVEGLVAFKERCLVEKPLRIEVDEAMADHPASLDKAVALGAATVRAKGAGWYVIGANQRAAKWLAKAGDAQATRHLYGRALLNAGQFLKAAEVLSTIDSDVPAARLPVAEAFLRAGDTPAARKTVARLLKKDRESPDGIYLQSYLHEQDGDYEQAFEGYTAGPEAVPCHPQATFRMAYMMDLDGRDDEAVELYEELRHREPTFTQALVNLGVLYEDRGEYTKAIEVYQQILDIYPNHPRARQFCLDAKASLNMYYDEDLERTEDRRAQILRIPISDFELSVRSRNCLAKMQIETLGDLIKRTEPELLSYKNFGETSLQEIKDILAQKGLRLGMGREQQTASVQAAARTLLGIEPEKGDVLEKRIDDLELSVRSRNAMGVLGVETLGDLAKLSEKDLMQVKNFGQTSMNEVKEKLAEFGLSLAEPEV